MRHKYHFKEKTEKREITKCTGCAYYRPLRSNGRSPVNMACHYLLDTGEIRGVPAKECYENKIHFKGGEEKCG